MLRTDDRSPLTPRRGLAALSLLLLASLASASPTPQLDELQRKKWLRFWEEQQAMELLLDISEEYRRETTAFVGASLIPMAEEGVVERAVVVVENGLIRALGPEGEVEIPAAARRVELDGGFLIPGLTDAHTHTIHSPAHLLIYLTRGVTTLREMDGYPWMLEARRRALRGDLLMPHLYVTGRILSNRAWDFYMIQVDTEEQVRNLVAEQAAAGYDFIKIHNSMPQPLFGTVFEAAAEAGLDVVGHIPNEISIAEAIAAGMRTNEHFKGYIFDETLQITEQDYLSATRGSRIWHTPTFVTYHDHLRGDEARAVVNREDSLRLVARWQRRGWQEAADQPVDRLTELRQSIYPKSRRLFSDIRPLTDRFLAGTDTGSYAMMVPGFALQEEVRIFQSLGMTPFEALETATTAPARAMRKESEFGTLEVGRRGDLLLLGANPLEDAAHLADVRGVSVAGVWLDRSALDSIESRLATLFSDETAVPAPNRESLAQLVQQAERIVERGFPYPGYILEEIRELLTELGLDDLAARLEPLAP